MSAPENWNLSILACDRPSTLPRFADTELSYKCARALATRLPHAQGLRGSSPTGLDNSSRPGRCGFGLCAIAVGAWGPKQGKDGILIIVKEGGKRNFEMLQHAQTHSPTADRFHWPRARANASTRPLEPGSVNTTRKG